MMTERQRFILVNEAVRRNCLEAVRCADIGSAVSIGPSTRSLDQNAKLWAMISDISKAKPDGRQHTPEVWKCLLMNACGYAVQFEIGLNGQPFPIGFSSSRLSKKEMADLITFALQWGDEKGVKWSEKEKGYYYRG